MDGGFRHQGLEEIYRTGKDAPDRRRSSREVRVGKCERILQFAGSSGEAGRI